MSDNGTEVRLAKVWLWHCVEHRETPKLIAINIPVDIDTNILKDGVCFMSGDTRIFIPPRQILQIEYPDE